MRVLNFYLETFVAGKSIGAFLSAARNVTQKPDKRQLVKEILDKNINKLEHQLAKGGGGTVDPFNDSVDNANANNNEKTQGPKGGESKEAPNDAGARQQLLQEDDDDAEVVHKVDNNDLCDNSPNVWQLQDSFSSDSTTTSVYKNWSLTLSQEDDKSSDNITVYFR